MAIETALPSEQQWNGYKKEYGIPNGAGKVSVGKLLASIEKAAAKKQATLKEVVKPLNALAVGVKTYRTNFAGDKKMMANPKASGFLKDVVDQKLVNGCKQLQTRMENCFRVFPRMVEASGEALARAKQFQTFIKRPIPPKMTPESEKTFKESVGKELTALYGLVTVIRSAITEATTYHPSRDSMNFIMSSVLEVNKLIQQGEKETLGAKLNAKDSKAKWQPLCEKIVRNFTEINNLCKASL